MLVLLHSSELFYLVDKLFSSVFVGAEKVETGTARGEENGVPLVCSVVGLQHRRMYIVGVDDLQAEGVEMLVEFLVMKSHEDKGVAFLSYQVVDFGVVVSFVFASKYENGGCVHALEGVPAGIDIGGFGVVDETDIANCGYILQSVFDTFELAECLANDVVMDIEYLRCETSCH